MSLSNAQVLSELGAGNNITAAEIAAGATPTNYEYTGGPGFIDIRRYGATTASPNNAVAIQTALNVAAASSSSGGIVYIPQGTWKITTGLTVAAGVTLCIQGCGKFNSILLAVGFTAGQAMLTQAGSTGARNDACIIRGLAFWDNTGGVATGINASWVINSSYDDLYFYQCQYGWVGTSCFGNSFRNNNAYLITSATYQLNSACNNNFFQKTRCAGVNGIYVTGFCDTLTIIGCDFEGITGNGAAINISPATGTKAYNVTIIGNHFENINGTAVFIAGVDATSTIGLVVKGNYITGGFAGLGNTHAVNAISLAHVINWDISNNEFQDWQTNGIYLAGTSGNAVNGEVVNNTSTVNTVTNLSDVAFASNVRVANNWTGLAVAYAPTSGWGTPTGATVVNNFPGATATLAQTSGAVAELIALLKAFGLLST